MYYDLEYT